MSKKRKLTVGNIYAVQWTDHFFADRMDTSDAEENSPVSMRNIGKLIGSTGPYLKFEHSRRSETWADGSYKHSFFAVIASDVVEVHDLGPDPFDCKRRSHDRKKRT
jgi:hypothetical protein